MTGATGLVGSHLVERLIERGDEVHALIRNHAKAKPLAQMGAILVEGDLTDADSLLNAMDNFDVVYHCAAQVALPHQGDRQHIISTNVKGTEDMLNACIQKGVKRFVFVSSVAVYGGSRESGITEDHPYDIHGLYSESKVRAEEAVLNIVKDHDIEWVMLRPCVIYGPRDFNFLPQFIDSFSGTFFPLINGGKAIMDLVYVTDVAEALILAGTSSEAQGEIYNVTDGGKHSVKHIVETMGTVMDRPFRAFYVPAWLALIFATISHSISKLLHPNKDQLISPDGVRTISKNHHFNSAKIVKELGFEPKVDLKHGLKMTLDWYDEWKETQVENSKPSLQGGF